MLALGGLLGWLFAPTFGWLATSWRAHPYYSHGPLLVAVALWLAWRSRRAWGGTGAGDGSNHGFWLILAGLAAHLAALRWLAFPLSAAGLVVVLLGLATLARGPSALRALAFPALLVLVAIPLPLAEHFAPPLAAGVAHAAAAAARVLGVAVTQTGAQLAVADGSFTVGAPCSGLRSLVALGSLAVLVAGLVQGPRWTRVALVAVALPLALAANWVRLTSLLVAAHWVGAERGLALFHDLASPLTFLTAVAGLVYTGRALGCDLPGREVLDGDEAHHG